MAEAVRLGAELAEPGDTVLLSPACASFDWYSGYAARGDDFAREVAALARSPGPVTPARRLLPHHGRPSRAAPQPCRARSPGRQARACSRAAAAPGSKTAAAATRARRRVVKPKPAPPAAAPEGAARGPAVDDRPYRPPGPADLARRRPPPPARLLRPAGDDRRPQPRRPRHGAVVVVGRGAGQLRVVVAVLQASARLDDARLHRPGRHLPHRLPPAAPLRRPGAGRLGRPAAARAGPRRRHQRQRVDPVARHRGGPLPAVGAGQARAAALLRRPPRPAGRQRRRLAGGAAAGRAGVLLLRRRS